MERGSFRPELHVAQQSRREKLRVLHNEQNVEVYSNHLDQFGASHDNPDLVHHLPSLSYEPATTTHIYSSEMLQQDVTMVPHHQDSRKPSNIMNSWKSIPSHERFDWTNNYAYQEIPSQKQYGGDMHNFYNNNELLLLPAFTDHSNPENTQSHRALSLSLSSSNTNIQDNNNMKTVKVGDYVDMGAGNSANFVANRSVVVGPLGPFTGYATILKSSKFLRPAQQLLDEFCNNILGPKLPINSLEAYDDKVSTDQIRCSSGGGVYGAESLGALAGDSGGSSSTFFSSNEKMREAAGGGLSSPNESCGPEFLQNKAKLFYMQEEVCRRYKHYHQQMQMVVSSFETAAGLSLATPYISLALKAVSKHFRFLKNAISDKLNNVRKGLGEDLSSSLTTGTNSSTKGETNSSKQQKLIDQTIHKQKTVGGGGNLGFFEQQHHVWRPQRGLPERSVAILRAWLFDHFLHPYPTDADKHMLATQTGLTRNQVSNWFINARVRVWKPMVEEIHTLESKAKPETGSNAVKPEGRATMERCSQSNDHSQTYKQAECPEIGSSAFPGNRMNNADSWNHEKGSRLECRIPGTMDGSLVGLMPYQQSGIDMGGLGAVSLTLGLRQNADGVQQQHPLQQQENQLRRHFGDHIIYDFVG